MTSPNSPSSPPSPFSPTLPTFQIAWDSTSLGWFKDCPRYYQYQMLLGYTPRSKGIHLAFGGYYASALERYAHYRADGLDHDAASIKMIRWTLTNAGERDEAGTFHPWTPSPLDPAASIKNLPNLIRSLVWNVEDRLNSPFRTHILANGRPAVELSFTFHAFDLNSEPIFLSGHMDEVVEETRNPASLWVRDDKTSKNALNAQYFAQYSPNNQMSLYSLAGRIILNIPVQGVLVKATQVGVNFNRFATQQVPRPKAVLDEWLLDTRAFIATAHSYALANHWPKNDKSCDKFGGCPFRKVCSVSPSHRDAWLKEDFVIREWNPLQARGDI